MTLKDKTGLTIKSRWTRDDGSAVAELVSCPNINLTLVIERSEGILLLDCHVA